MPRISRRKAEELLLDAGYNQLDVFAVERLVTIFGYRQEFLVRVDRLCDNLGRQPSSLEDINEALSHCTKQVSPDCLDEFLKWFAKLHGGEKAIFVHLAYEDLHALSVHILDLKRIHPEVNVNAILIEMEQLGIVWRNPENDGSWEPKVLAHRFNQAWLRNRWHSIIRGKGLKWL